MTARLFTAAVITPIDLGWEKPMPPHQRKKYRPIAGREVLMKFVESVNLDVERAEVSSSLEPFQLGCGTPDACPIIVTTIQSWMSDAVHALSHGDDRNILAMEDPATFTVASLDETNAYGRALRSVCLRGARTMARGVAGLAAAQWQCQGTVVWQRVDGSWRRSCSLRGGWQGSQLMQNLYALGQEVVMREPMGPCGQSLSQMGIARIALLDDQHLAGPAGKLAEV